MKFWMREERGQGILSRRRNATVEVALVWSRSTSPDLPGANVDECGDGDGTNFEAQSVCWS
jgi:hypothetical protein